MHQVLIEPTSSSTPAEVCSMALTAREVLLRFHCKSDTYQIMRFASLQTNILYTQAVTHVFLGRARVASLQVGPQDLPL